MRSRRSPLSNAAGDSSDARSGSRCRAKCVGSGLAVGELQHQAPTLSGKKHVQDHCCRHVVADM